MENEFLDEVLQKIEKKPSCYFEVLESEYHRSVVIDKLNPAIEYLIKQGLIKTSLIGSQTYLELSPEGKRHILSGGFVAKEKYEIDLLNYSKGSRDYARKAYKVAIIGVVLTIVLFIISLVFKH